MIVYPIETMTYPATPGGCRRLADDVEGGASVSDLQDFLRAVADQLEAEQTPVIVEQVTEHQVTETVRTVTRVSGPPPLELRLDTARFQAALDAIQQEVLATFDAMATELHTLRVVANARKRAAESATVEMERLKAQHECELTDERRKQAEAEQRARFWRSCCDDADKAERDRLQRDFEYASAPAWKRFARLFS